MNYDTDVPRYILECLLSACALLDPKTFGGKRLTVLTPRLPGDREDKRWTNTIDPLVALRDKYHSQHYSYLPLLLSAIGCYEMLTINAHPETLRCGGVEIYGKMPLRSLSAIQYLAGNMERLPGDIVVVSPDKEGNKGRELTRQFSEHLGLDCRYVDKERISGEAVQANSIIDLGGRPVLLFDDTSSTFNSILSGAKSLRNCPGIYVAIIHPNLASHGRERLITALESGIEGMPLLGVTFGNTIDLELPQTESVRNLVRFVDLSQVVVDYYSETS
jgi:phosphoribosylpyrophosphate synthetase